MAEVEGVPTDVLAVVVSFGKSEASVCARS